MFILTVILAAINILSKISYLAMETYPNQKNLFSYCSVCRINHNQKRNHIFTTKHKQKLKIVLQKFGTRIKLCRPYLENPVIEEFSDEKTEKFWCHFCMEEINKHVTDHFKAILYGGLFEHIANEKHYEAIEKFWVDNGAEAKYKSQFIISQTDLRLYKQKLIPLVDKYENKTAKRTNEIAKQIKTQENIRIENLYKANAECEANMSSERIIYRSLKNKHGIIQNPTGYHDGIRVWRSGIMKYSIQSNQIIPSKYVKTSVNNAKMSIPQNQNIYTVDAKSDITFSKVKLKFDKSKGNIFTGAKPPWLIKERDDDSSNETKIIGPSISDLEKHLKKKEKAKLNPKRVGANFDHNINDTSETWLPSFGRVWTQGARWKSRHEYRNEAGVLKKKKKQ